LGEACEEVEILIPVVIIDGVNIIELLINFGIATLIYLLVALTINLEFGYAGVPNFGKVLFVAAGGLFSGSISYYLMAWILDIKSNDLLGNQFIFHNTMDAALLHSPALDLGLFSLMIVVGALSGAAFGYLASYPAIRLREDYLAMLLLAAGEFFLIFDTAYTPINDGPNGLNLPSILGFTGTVTDYRQVVLLGLLAVATVGVYLYCERIARSPLGRTLRAVRDNEISSAALGKNNVAIRRHVLTVGSAIAGIIGVLVVVQTGYIDPTTFTRQYFTLYPFVVVILGGAANNFGVVVGSIVFEGIIYSVYEFQTYAGVHNISIPIDLNAVTYIAIGVLLILVLYFRPKGLIAEKASLTLKRNELLKIKAQAERSTSSNEKPTSSSSNDETQSTDSGRPQ
jgi:branched-chain amino acid transport system permease protein